MKYKQTLGKIACESFHFRKDINKKCKLEVGKPLGVEQFNFDKNKTINKIKLGEL